MSYQPSEVLILAHVKTAEGEATTITPNPTEIGTVANPVVEGTVVSIEALLVKTADSAPIEGKALHLYDSAGGELQIRNTDAEGKAWFQYTANISDDSKHLKIAYLGD